MSMKQFVSLLLVVVLTTGTSAKNLHAKRYQKQKALRELERPGITFRDTRQVECTDDQFSCQYKCIPKSYVCDVFTDCTGGEDEENCPTDCSGENMFKCANGQCTSADFKCDQYDDCGDNSDELNCGYTCSPSRFSCTNGACISAMFTCDGDDDCGDNSDEADCDSRTCRPDQFTCATLHRCIPASYQCDSFYDCTDRSDEINCSCGDGHFQCPKGGCIPAEYMCDGDNDCGDMEDEQGCADMHPGACADRLTYEDCVRMNTATYPICDYYEDAHRYCRKYCDLCGT